MYQVHRTPGRWQLVRRAESAPGQHGTSTPGVEQPRWDWQLAELAEPAPGLISPRVQRTLERCKRARAATERAIENEFIEQHGTSFSPLSMFKKHHSHSRSRAATLGHIGG